MKLIYILLISIVPFLSYSQSYIGIEVGKRPTFVLNQEIDTSFIVLSLKTNIGEESTLQGKIGFKIGSPKLHVVVFSLPIFNLNLKTNKYNTPFNVELRYNPKLKIDSKLELHLRFGVELYKNGNYPYLNILIPFK